MSSTCQGWHLYTQWSVGIREKGVVLERQVRRRVISGVFCSWLEFSSTAARERAEARRLELEHTAATHVREVVLRKVLMGGVVQVKPGLIPLAFSA